MNSSKQIRQTVNKDTIRQRGQLLAAQFKQPEPLEYKLVCANDDQHIELRTQVIKAVNTEAPELSRTERDLIYEYVLHSFDSEQNAEHWLEQLSNDITILAPSKLHAQRSIFERTSVWLLTQILISLTWFMNAINALLSSLAFRDKTSGYQRGTRIGMVIGAGILLYTAYAFHEATDRAQKEYQQAHVERWKKTDGTIATITSRLDKSGSRHQPKWGEYEYKDGNFYRYYYTVTYHYQVERRTYSFDRLSFPSSIFGQAEDRETPIKPQFKPGQHVSVWYDPTHPENATLDKRMP